MATKYRHPDALVTTDWLGDHLNDPDLRVFECTAFLSYLPPGREAPYRVVSGRAEYELGHIEGAGFLDIQDELSDPRSPPHLRFKMLPAETLAVVLGSRGIGDGHRVVLYSRGRLVWSTRVWWMLRAIGFDSATVLDGGWEKWVREQRPTSTREPSFPPATLTPHPRSELFVAKEAVRRAIDDADTCLVNALEPDLHRGENPRYGRRGRIPGSVNVPSSSLVDPETNTFLPAEQSDNKFRDVGLDRKKRTVVYCGGGIAATLDAFVLHRLGYRELSVYDASMSEWARDPSLPIETD
ncbi:MAG TPA: sulfurtransferase [Gammaproteobacteria bacterium]|nr:sulfurtransferase [Gammaproteobacteria bacterium]